MLLLLSFSSVSCVLNQLSFSGGGSFGAVEIGIIKRLMERKVINFDLYTGISAGALNAGFLSYYKNIKEGITKAENIYKTINNRMVYKLLPSTEVSLLNTEPLFNTFLKSSSAIPGLFPPIRYNGNQYADGGTLSNELLQVENNDQYINITFVTPYEGYIYDNTPIDSLKEMIKRTINIVTSNFNNPLVKINQNCEKPIGEINKYFVDPELLKGYNILNFDNGKELIDIGYNNVEYKKYKLC
jgi:predicted acylesterase/phospholipase RssA